MMSPRTTSTSRPASGAGSALARIMARTRSARATSCRQRLLPTCPLAPVTRDGFMPSLLVRSGSWFEQFAIRGNRSCRAPPRVDAAHHPSEDRDQRLLIALGQNLEHPARDGRDAAGVLAQGERTGRRGLELDRAPVAAARDAPHEPLLL